MSWRAFREASNLATRTVRSVMTFTKSLVLSALLIFMLVLSSCADDDPPRFYDYDLTELSDWQQAIFIEKAIKWESIIGYRLFGFGGTTNRVYFGDTSPQIYILLSNGDIALDGEWFWFPCNDIPWYGDLVNSFDDIISHNLGYVIGNKISNDPNNIMHVPPPKCLF